MKILVTGGAGFIGSALTSFLNSNNNEVLTLDALIDTTYSANIKKNRWKKMKNDLIDVEFFQFNLLNQSQIRKIPPIDAIVHLAAIPGLDLSWQNLNSYTDNNILATKNVIDLAIAHNAKLVHISTSSVYGEYASGNESQACKPVSPYGVTKLAAENLIRAYAANNNLDFTILRFFSIYGPGQRPDMGYEKFIHNILNNETIHVFGDGTARRSNTYLADCLQAVNLTLYSPPQSRAVNIAGHELISVGDAIEIISELLSIKPNIEFSPRRKGDQMVTSGETFLAETELRWKSQTSFEDGIINQIEICKTKKCQELAFKLF
jgi:UDP-glucuronate 4-epimerase